jgi:hypothetical protein
VLRSFALPVELMLFIGPLKSLHIVDLIVELGVQPWGSQDCFQLAYLLDELCPLSGRIFSDLFEAKDFLLNQGFIIACSRLDLLYVFDPLLFDLLDLGL